MKRKWLEKFLCGILVFMMFFNFSVTSYADNTTEDGFFAEIEERYGGGEVLMDGIVGTLTSIIRIPMIFIGDSISVILGVLGKSAGLTNVGNNQNTPDVGFRLTPEDVLFNRLELISLNFFDVGAGGSGSASGAIQEIRKNVAIWYYAIRNIALGVLLCIFIYVAIRMILSTVASDKAVYKKMLQDWLVGIVLLFMLHYIIVGSIMLNNVLVEDVMGGALIASSNAAGTKTLGDFTSELREQGSKVFASASKTWGAAIVYIMVVFVTLTFLYKYIMRMLTIGFLIIISPLITITYSIDKMGDGKSQALNTWLKEFEYNILIQPFHCILYMVFVKTAIDILDGTLAAMVLAILCMKFVWDGEKIVKNIFGFNNAKSVGDSLIAAGGAITAMKTVGGLASNATVGAKGGGGAIKGTGGNSGANAALAGGAVSGTPGQTPKLKDSPVLREADQKQKAGTGKATQAMRNAYQNSGPGFKGGLKRVAAGAGLGIAGAANTIKNDVSNKVHNGVNTIKGYATNPGKTFRAVGRGAVQAAFTGVAFAAAAATGNFGLAPDAMKAGLAIGRYTAQKADAIPARVSRARDEEKFRKNTQDNAANLRNAGNSTDENTKAQLDVIKGNAAKFRRDEHGKRVNANQAFGEESIADMIQDYKEHGSERVNDQYNDAVSAFHQEFGDNANAKDMLALGNMDAQEFQNALLTGSIAGISAANMTDAQKAAAYNFYDASQRKAIIDNADRMQGSELSLGNTDAQKDVSAMMEESMLPQQDDSPTPGPNNDQQEEQQEEQQDDE